MTIAQNAQILAHLKSGKTITPIEALNKYGCLRLSGRIYDIRAAGHPIETTIIKLASGKRVGRYGLADG